MEDFKKFNGVAAAPVKIRKKINDKMQTVLVDDNIFTFDTETTSVFIFPDRIEKFNFKNPPEYYRDATPAGYLYIWMFSVNNKVFYGRRGEDFTSFLHLVSEALEKIRFIVYVHNLPFDFQFLRNYITDFEVFARSPRQPLTAYSPTFNVEFRDSLALTNCKLEKLPAIFELPVKKQTGLLDYNVIRHSSTPLTKEELKYCEYDCLVLYHLICKFKGIYGSVAKIPLTQTGIVRKECQKLYQKNSAYHAHIRQIYPKTAGLFYFIMRAFWGGYTHANYLYIGEILKDIDSWDITSSYPFVMLSEKYPQSPWVKSHVSDFKNLDTKNFCYILDITFTNLNSKTYNHFLSRSKCYNLYKCVTDNGRIVSAERVRVFCTNVDLDIIRKTYKFTDYKINKAVRSKLGYLDRDFLLKILELYGLKTKLKNVAGKNLDYQLSKQKLNSLYGMSVTNLIKDDFKFDNNAWEDVRQLTDNEVTDKLQEISKSFATFLTPSYGIFVTAYARHNLWENIIKLDKDVVYSDTDSVKFIGKHDDVISAYNKKAIKKLKKAMVENDIDLSLIEPKDPKGVSHVLGVFEHDGHYDRFVTLGAKKYSYEIKGEVYLTLSGVNSSTGAKGLEKLENFKKGFLFDYKSAGKHLVSYNDNQPPVTLVDEYGVVETRCDLYGVNLRPNIYSLGVDPEFEHYYLTAPNFSLKCSNIETADL